MENLEALRKRLLRKTKPQLVDEIASLIGRVADLERAVGNSDVEIGSSDREAVHWQRSYRAKWSPIQGANTC